MAVIRPIDLCCGHKCKASVISTTKLAWLERQSFMSLFRAKCGLAVSHKFMPLLQKMAQSSRQVGKKLDGCGDPSNPSSSGGEENS